MDARLTEQGRAVIDGAHSAAAGLGHADVGTEHLLLALTRTPCAARRILESLGLSEQRVHAKGGRADRRWAGGRSVEAKDLGHATTDAEHILLALAHDPSGAALLSALGVDEQEVEAAIARHHRATPSSEPPPRAALTTSG